MSLQEEAFFNNYQGIYTDVGFNIAAAKAAATPTAPRLATAAEAKASGLTDVLSAMNDQLKKDVADNIAMHKELNQPLPPTIAEIAKGVGVPVNNVDKTVSLTAQQNDAIAGISALLSSYGIGDLGPSITEAVQKGYSNDTIQLIMQDPNSKDPLAVAYQERFPANKARLAAGKSVLSASDYLRAERSYTEVLQAYGMGSMAKPDTLNKFISNDVSATEVSDRVALAVNKVQNADAATKRALAEFYPMLNQNDIVGAMLNPEDSLPALQRKIQISQIGGAAMAAGLNLSTSEASIKEYQKSAEELASLGITQDQARAGYANIAEITPRAEFLSSISTGADYGQKQAEQEQFQGLASAKRARQELAATEQARFAGSAGTSKGAFSTGYLNKTSGAGQF